MELNLFHKTVLTFAFLILGIGIFNSVSENFMSPYNEISAITEKYDIVSFEPLSEPPIFLSQAWLKNTMVSSLINVETSETPKEGVNELIVKIDNPSPTQNLYLLTFPSGKSINNIERDLKEIETVAFVEPNYSIDLQQDEELQENDTPQNEVDVEAEPNSQLKDLTANVKDVLPEESEDLYSNFFKVAIIDSGVDVNHPSLKGKHIYPKTYLSNLSDKVGHGTHLAGLIFEKAPDTQLYSYKFTDGKTGKLSGVLKAINQAEKDNVDLVNLSLGLPNKSEALQEAIELLRKNNIIVVAAAGNQNTDSEFYPAAYNGVIAVGGLTTTGDKLPNSNFGEWIDFSIRGQDLYSLAPDGQFKYLSGTSQSAAVVSGLISQYYNSLESRKDADLNKYLSVMEFKKEDQFENLLGLRIQE